ncbi:MAG: ABC-2 family transporter protein [Anaerolineales bacterium]
MREFKFLLALWKTSLLAAMEYRVPFVLQIAGMMLNNSIYFLVWVIFFQRFDKIRGWGVDEMFLVFGISAVAFGTVMILFGNARTLSDVIAQGQLDYYLTLPRPVLLHTLANRSITSGLGDLTYGILSFLLSKQVGLSSSLRFILASVLATTVFLSFMVLMHSLSFWSGYVSAFADLAVNAILSFAIYPITLFDGTAKFILFTILPAALIGAVPAEFVSAFTWQRLAQMLIGALVLLWLSIVIFYRGLRRYESGSAIQTQV